MPKKQTATNELIVLKSFVEEFSPLHQGQAQNMNYYELFLNI